ncbi:MAG: tRNA epoxyqueuosine(34) reductase QueG [candidate division Zixibacteria bacterium]|nr:tRNA epoxyqueuosine(34) reductase QueG [candidate division Zixibacteria bacterium]
MDNLEFKELILSKAHQLGFDLAGICCPEYSPTDHSKLLNWLEAGYQGEMAFMERNPRLRSDLRLFMENVQSVISVGINYFKEPDYQKDKPYVSIYARGKPYQDVVKNKLQELLDYIKRLTPEAEGKIAVDTSPTLDKLWAEKAGLGWRGKNTLVINKKIGSFIFLGELFLNIKIEPDVAESDHCADCRKCLDICPTGALEEPHLLNSTKCISYMTIEANNPPADQKLIDNHIFGCDLCQIICPYNKNASTTTIPEFQPGDIYSMEIDKWINLTENDFQSRYMGTILGKYGFSRCTNNVKMAMNNLAID